MGTIMYVRKRFFPAVAFTFMFLCCLHVNAHGKGVSKTEWMAVLLEGQKMGYTKQTRTIDDRIVITRQDLNLEVRRGDIPPMKIKSMVEITETADGLPLGFKYEQAGPGSFVKSQGARDPDGKFRVRVGTAPQNEKESILDLPEGVVMEEGSRLLARKMGLKEGTTYQYRQFMPDSLRVLDVSTTVGKTMKVDLLGRAAPLTEIEQTLRADGESILVKSYVDEEFELQKVFLPMMGMKMELIVCTEQYALSENDPADFFNAALIHSPKRLSRRELTKAISYELTPKDGKTLLSLPSTDEQIVKPQTNTGKLVIEVRKIKAMSGVKFPYEGIDEVALNALKPTNWLQSDAKDIIALAGKAVGDSKDSAQAVHSIQNFVGTYISKKDLSVGYASALEVANTREGDCTEHAVLAAALCRAVGIPARVATGIAYAEQFSGRKDIFVPHAWTQAYVGGKWISMDAALGGFDAGHITLGIGDGDPFYFFSLVNILGNFEVTGSRALHSIP